MQELEEWIKSSAANKRYFRQQLLAWASATEKNEAYLYNKDKAFQRFKNRALHAQDAILPKKSLLRDINFLSGHRLPYYKFASCAALLLIIMGLCFYLLKKDDSFHHNTIQKEERLSFVQIDVPLGIRKKCILPDKSVVWLNAGSVFKYPINFKGKTREVFLDGEGYFSVAKDKEHPFIVNTSKGNITVTGTTFNVYSYALKSHFVTALLEGHVRVSSKNGKSVDLLPSQKAELDNQTLLISPISDPDEYKWMDGLICFNNEEITDVLERLQSSFGSKIVIKNLKNPHLHLTGKFRVEDGLEYALKVLGDSYGIKYKQAPGNKGYTITN